MKRARIVCALLIAAFCALGGCGQKGPLTLGPDPEPATAAPDQGTEDGDPEGNRPGDR